MRPQQYNDRLGSTSSVLQELAQQPGQPGSQGPPAPAGPVAHQAASSAVGAGGKLASPSGKSAAARPSAARRFPLLFREINRHMAVQLPTTKPHTLYNTVICLARLGYYDARLYTKIVASLEMAGAPPPTPHNTAVAAATATSCAAEPILCKQQQQQQQEDVGAVGCPVSTGRPVLSHEHLVQLLCVCAHFQHPAPALWLVVLPRLVAQQQQLQPPQLVVLLTAARHSAVGSTVQERAALMPGLLQLAVAALQQQDDLNLLQLLQLAAAGTWVHAMAADLSCQPGQLQHLEAREVQLLVQLTRAAPSAAATFGVSSPVPATSASPPALFAASSSAMAAVQQCTAGGI